MDEHAQVTARQRASLLSWLVDPPDDAGWICPVCDTPVKPICTWRGGAWHQICALCGAEDVFPEADPCAN